MITIRLQGGLGNQMFQYAFALAYSLKNNTDFQFDVRYLTDRTPRKHFIFRDYDLCIFNVNPQMYPKIRYFPYQVFAVLASERIQKIFCKDGYSSITGKYLERCFRYNQGVFDLPDGTYFEGFFQSYKYFYGYQDIIKEHFRLRPPINHFTLRLLSEIKKSESVCIHVRRTDLLTNKLLGVVDMGYYYKAVASLQRKLCNIKLFVFSDDIDWCISQFHFNVPVWFVTDNYTGDKCKDYFELMRSCKHFIISNSTFGWWAAYLSENSEKTVFAPKLWFNNNTFDSSDLIPSDWTRIPPNSF